MSRQKNSRRSCPTPGKHAYATRRNAHRATNEAARRGLKLRIYQCQCGFWHLTSQPRRTAR